MAILDNRSPQTSVGNYLQEKLADGLDTLRIVSAYFTVYAYEMLRDSLGNAGTVRFLYGDPASVGELDPATKEDKNFDLTERELSPKRLLQQKRLAMDCEQWIKNQVEIRTVKQVNFLHGKMYHLQRPGDTDVAVVGSSNFTRRGLGFDSGSNLELNLPIVDAVTCDELKRWFDAVWNDKQLVKDAKDEVLAALRRLGENLSPELVYYKTLLEVFRDRLAAREKTGGRLEGLHLRDTSIWKTLYPFQRDGVTGVIHRLRQHNGCILADSVGLGKTYTALAVIRYYEAQNKRVLVLCPKKLSENWRLYVAQLGHRGNPFKEDNLHYTVLHHTDLSRDSGESNGIDLAAFDWGAYGLVVIDESHNFRNESHSTRDENGHVIRRSRYERLLEEVVKATGETHVLMLSATPVNTSLADLRNQLYLMTGKQENAFQETLGISNLRATLGVAQKHFKEWEHGSGKKNKRDLFEKLGGHFFMLLDAVSIARSRRHVEKFYPEVVEKIGGFPERARPENQNPPTDTQSALSYKTLDEEISDFRLSIYTPTAYVISERGQQKLVDEKRRYNFNQADREHWLIDMIRVNFLKRLESSARSLVLTLDRTIDKIEQLTERINKYQANMACEDEADEVPEDEPDDEDFVVSKTRRPFHFEDLDLSRWLNDLHKDRETLENVRSRVAAITPERDGKLASLTAQLRHKLRNPTIDKDGRKNRKVLVFTAFKDTAIYLYDQLETLIGELEAKCAMVAGDETKTTFGRNTFNDILTNFSPMGRGRFKCDEHGVPIPDGQTEIDILIATDCISEGQNLQDCDLVVNYDIHWNPVRLIQRFGRVDRIGSRNKQVCMSNYWPTAELDDYLNLRTRVQARMALVNATATGDDPLIAEDETRDNAKREVNFRDAQLLRMRNEVLDLDEMPDAVALSDFSLDDFLAQLEEYLRKSRKELENTPLGVYAIVDQKRQTNLVSGVAAPGVIFCLRQKTPPRDRQARSPLQPHYLVYVRHDGDVHYNYLYAKQTLELFGELARGQDKPLLALCDAFDRETSNGRNMNKYNKLLDSVFSAISKQFTQQEVRRLSSRDGVLPKRSEQPRNTNDFELVTWLVIKGDE